MKRLLSLLTITIVCAASAQSLDQDPTAALADLPRSEVRVETAGGRHTFQVWIAENHQSRRQGLMYIKDLPSNQGMLFLFDRPQFASFWMKNTYVSLDIAFIAPNGVVVNIAHNTPPMSLELIWSVAPVMGVLELKAGTAARIGLVAGDRVRYSDPAPP